MPNSIETVLSPALLHLYDVQNKAVVVIDILRATSSMCTAFENGATSIIPVATPEEAMALKDNKTLIAAERNAIKLDGFDLGNSPFEFNRTMVSGMHIAFTTTNGTKAIQMAHQAGAAYVVIGAFLNIDALFNYLKQINKPVVLLCSAWKDKVNIEDTLFAGAIASKLTNLFNTECDSTLLAKNAYESNRHRLVEFVNEASHAKRFKLLHMQTDDVTYCMQQNTTHAVPVLQNGKLINASVQE